MQKHSWYLRPHLQFKCKLDRLLADESADWSISCYFSTVHRVKINCGGVVDVYIGGL